MVICEICGKELPWWKKSHYMKYGNYACDNCFKERYDEIENMQNKISDEIDGKIIEKGQNTSDNDLKDRNIKKIPKNSNTDNTQKDELGNFFRTIGIWIIIVGIIGAIIIGIYLHSTMTESVLRIPQYMVLTYSIGEALAVFGGSFLTGLILIGIGGILERLTRLNNTISRQPKQ